MSAHTSSRLLGGKNRRQTYAVYGKDDAREVLGKSAFVTRYLSHEEISSDQGLGFFPHYHRTDTQAFMDSAFLDEVFESLRRYVS